MTLVVGILNLQELLIHLVMKKNHLHSGEFNTNIIKIIEEKRNN